MKTSKLLLLGTLVLALFMSIPAMAITFTGDVEADFDPTTDPNILVITDPGGQDLSVNGGISGWDIKDIRLSYDSGADIMYVGFNSYGIVGDVDGDGSPDPPSSDDSRFVEESDLCGGESVAVYFDLDMQPLPFSNNSSWDVIAGVKNGPSSNFGTDLLGHVGTHSGSPDVSSPDFEFTILNFSGLASTLGLTDLQLNAFRVGAYMGSPSDGDVGEDFTFYQQEPSTAASITPSALAVIDGGTITLTVTEENDSPNALVGQQTGPSGSTPVELPFHDVKVKVMMNGSLAYTLTDPPDGGDTSDTGVLNIGETWSWTIPGIAVTQGTTFVAQGSGTGPIGFIHTYEEDSDEEAQVVVKFLSTDVDIEASDTSVPLNSTVDLTVRETNDGSEDLTNVQVVVTQNGVALPWSPLGASPDSGDTSDPGVLNVGETWVWNRTSNAITVDPTDFVATGSADFDGITVTWPEDDEEQDSVTVGVLVLSTMVTIEPSGTVVPLNSTVDLTVTEENDGEADLTNVQVVVTQNGVALPWSPLGASPDSGDTSDPGVLNVGETWVWNRTSNAIAVNPTDFVAIGSGDFDGITVTWPDDPEERAEARVIPQDPSTAVTITASDTLVCEGDPVTLTICELNDGQVALSNVEVVVNDGASDIATLTDPPDSGDFAPLGVLDIGETWCWDHIVPAVNVTTTFTAIGYGEFDGMAVTWCDPAGPAPPPEVFCDDEERDLVTVETEPCGGEGCTPGFWKNNGDKHGASAWCDLFSPATPFGDVFDLDEPLIIRGKGRSTISNPTLLQALGANGGGVNAMVRHGVAAMLNACSDCVNYPTNDPLQVILMIEDALNGVGAFTVDELHSMFAENNEAGCPVNQHGACVGVEVDGIVIAE
jgi:hypothetical protein